MLSKEYRLLKRLLSSCLLVIVLVGSTQKNTSLTQLVEPTRLSLPGKSASGPYLTRDHQGNVLVSWVQQVSGEQYLLYYARSKDGGQSFAPAQAIATTGKVYTHEENLSKIAFKPNGDMVAIFSASNPSKQNQYAGMLYYTQSFDAGTTWTPPQQLSQGGESSTDERYFDLSLLPDGELGAVWLDARKGSHHEGSSLYLARTQGRKGFVREQRIDSSLCQCCRTRIQTDAKGRIHLSYRAIVNDSIRDMVHRVSLDEGNTFSVPKRISADNWVIRGCPHTGPTMMADGSRVHFAWHTQGGGTGLYYTQSGDQGESFAARSPISKVASAKHPQMSILPGGATVIVWDERYEQGETKGFRIGLQHRDKNGNVLHTQYLTSQSGSATHPVILTTKAGNLLIAYTQHGEQTDEIYYQTIDLP